MICQDSKSEGYVLSGIVSWGLTCALEKFPGVYSNIAYFKYWIKEQEEMVRIIIWTCSDIHNSGLHCSSSWGRDYQK